MPKPVPIAVVLLAGGYRASREGKDRIIATGELLERLAAMGIEVDRSDPPAFEKTQHSFKPLSVE